MGKSSIYRWFAHHKTLHFGPAASAASNQLAMAVDTEKTSRLLQRRWKGSIDPNHLDSVSRFGLRCLARQTRTPLFMSHKMAISWLLYDILTIVYYGRIYIGYICINWPMGFIKKDRLWLPSANTNGYNWIYIGYIYIGYIWLYRLFIGSLV